MMKKLTKEQEDFIQDGLKLFNKKKGKPVHKLHEKLVKGDE